jgi:hydantoinase/carbamoylase family amidase
VHMKDALQQIGYLGQTPCDYRENGLECHFELHIEQGPIPEEGGKSVGIVTSMQSMKWFAIRVEGIEGHSRTTPMPGRADAVVTASRLIVAVRDVALKTQLGVATVGVIDSDTSSQATIPTGIGFTIDMRCSTDEMVKDLATRTFAAFDTIVTAEANGTAYRIERSWGLSESKFHPRCIEAIRASAAIHVGEDQILDMKSRAGHDSAWTSRVCPTGMIFVPSKDSISHNPREYTSQKHCALGAQVLLDAVMYYDEKVKSGSF